MRTGYYWCSGGHVYPFGDEQWHYEGSANQWINDDGIPIPRYCQADLPNGVTCMDSSTIVGPFDTADEAQKSYDERSAIYR